MPCRKGVDHQRRNRRSAFRVANSHQHIEEVYAWKQTAQKGRLCIHGRLACVRRRAQLGIDVHGPLPHAALGVSQAKETA